MKADILGGMVPQDAEMFRSREYAPPPGMTWESVQELCKKILVVIPFRAGTGIQEGLCSHWGFWGNLGLKCADVKDPHGGFIEAVRAGMVRLFLDYVKIRPEIEYLVMIDNDEAIEWDAPIRIARHGVQVCTGVVCGANDEKGIFACFTVKGKDGGAYWPSLNETAVMPAEGLVEVHQCGTGLLAIHKSVFEIFRQNGEIPFYIPEEIRRITFLNGDLRKSEDICFSDACEKLGIKRYADLSVHAVHYKYLGIRWPENKIDPNLKAEDWDVRPSGIPVGGADGR